MTDTYFEYDQMVQGALKGVVRKILDQVAEVGLINDHHFYIAFRTTDEGVEIPDHLRERYPEEMTIVLQNHFWGLKVLDDRFEVGLSFNRKPEHLRIPYDAIVGFVDPSAKFALQFETTEVPGKAENDPMKGPEPTAEIANQPEAAKEETSGHGMNVIALDAFRQKSGND